jgi:CHAT domain-containing protein
MTNASHATGCPGPDTLAAFAEGHLTGAAFDAVVAHLDTCDECTHEVALAMRALEEEKGEEKSEEKGEEKVGEIVVRPRRWMPWLAAAAAAIAVVALIPALRSGFHRSPLERLVALAPRAARSVEPRLTGGFAWSPYRGSERASGTANADPERMKLAGAAGELVERAQHDAGAEAQHGAGVALVLTQNLDEAMARLEAAARTAPSAQSWSDLAAARYAAASDLGRAALYPQALAAADEALRLQENLPEARFNRALILERMGLTAESRAAWTRYLAIDPSSKWANEARAHLSELPAVTQSSRFDRDRPLLESEAARGDTSAVRRLLTAYAPRARAFAETEYLGRWAEATLQKSDVEAERWLTISRSIGAGVAGNLDDTLLRDAVRAIDDAPPSRREVTAAAHAAYRAGRIAYNRQQLEEASRHLERAAALFAQGRSPMALAARYYTASVRLAKNESAAVAELERILLDVDAHPEYRSLRAHVRWETGRARMFDYDWPRAASILSEGAAMFRAGGDRTNEAAVESILAYCHAAAGRGDESWSARILALRALSAEGSPARLTGVLGGAMRAERLAGRNDAALALARLAQPVAGDAAQLPLVLDALQFESMLQSANGNGDEALRAAKRAALLAQGVADPSLRARRLADADVAIGAATALSDPAGALAPLGRAIDFYRRSDFPFALPEPLLVRARCALRTGNLAAATRDLEEGMAIVEQHRASAGGGPTIGIFDADAELFAEAIRMHLDRGANAAAFMVAERSRGASITAAELQARLAGSATAVLEIAAAPGEIILFAITENELRIARRRATIHGLVKLAADCLAEPGTTAAAALYDELVRPLSESITSVRNVIVVPDPRLECVPFAALYDAATAHYLVERAGVAIASSSASLLRENASAGGLSVATVALPAGGGTGMPALPKAEQELAEIAALYRRATAIASSEATLSALRNAVANAEVVHIAGHTERQASDGASALLLAGGSSSGLERASSRTIAAMTWPRTRVIVLAACETLRTPLSAETKALSLGAAFSAAGAAAGVIGTLTPIGDHDARTFFRALHRQLASGKSAGDALRAAQISAIHEQTHRGGSQTWRSIALVTRGITPSKG